MPSNSRNQLELESFDFEMSGIHKNSRLRRPLNATPLYRITQGIALSHQIWLVLNSIHFFKCLVPLL
jgi:hypothetical protein